jgi:shikimate kinase
MPQRRNIVLTGFMGTGKSSVAREVARLTGLKLVEVDEETERAAGMKIRDIFEQHGEARFRDMETEQVKLIAEGKGQVISTGGGVVLRDENIKALKASGVVICLWASPEAILERTGRNKDRPLLNVDDPKAKIEELLAQRESCYAQADITIQTEGKTPREVAKEILEKTGWKA